MGVSTLSPAAWVFIAQKQEKRSIGTSLFASATFRFLFLSFYLFLCSQLPLNIIVYRFVKKGFVS